MRDVWTLAEQHKGKIKDVSFELLARGRGLADTLGGRLCSIVLSSGIDKEELRRLIYHGADIVYFVDSSCLEHVVCETYTHVLSSLIDEYLPHVFLAAATTTGRTVLPYLAVKIHTGLTADCTELAIEEETGNLLQTRPAIGGNIMATIKTPRHRPQMATVRPKSMKALPEDRSRIASIGHAENSQTGKIHSGSIIQIPWNPAWCDKRVTVSGIREDDADSVSIEEADLVVSGGRGLKKRDNFHLIDELAHAFGAQVGASRDAVDRGWVSYPHQVGLSGKTISPRLYMGIGISGAVQHLAGIKTAECIVAVNSDEHANILQVADFAIVGDLFAVIPEIQRRLDTKDGNNE